MIPALLHAFTNDFQQKEICRVNKPIRKIFSQTGNMVDVAKGFFKLEAAGGIVLVIAAIVAMLIANTSLYGIYNYFLNEIDFTIGFSDKADLNLYIGKPILLWINDGLMAVFFFLVGLEIKREFLEGELSSKDRALLPAIVAVGGMAAPAAIFYFINQHTPQYMPGWAIPAATDIAFALGIMALLGSRVPLAAKVLLTAIAIIDDLGAILIIALFYTADVKVMALVVAFVALLMLGALNRSKVCNITPYILIGTIMWIAVLKSGVHATLAGVVTALFIPMRSDTREGFSPVKHLEHTLHPWVAFMILPIFGFANAGISFAGMTPEEMFTPLSLGIAAGLFFGKQIGIFVPLVLLIKSGIFKMPKRCNWWHLYGVALLCGVGFTMSLFIGGLAFDTQDNAAAVRIGVIMGSVCSGIIGFLVLRFAPSKMSKDARKVEVKAKNVSV